MQKSNEESKSGDCRRFFFVMVDAVVVCCDPRCRGGMTQFNALCLLVWLITFVLGCLVMTLSCTGTIVSFLCWPCVCVCVCVRACVQMLYFWLDCVQIFEAAGFIRWLEPIQTVVSPRILQSFILRRKQNVSASTHRHISTFERRDAPNSCCRGT